MTLFAFTKSQETSVQIALAAVLGAVGLFLLLPRPRGRNVAGGIAALLTAAAVFGIWSYRTYGNPMPDVIGTILFWLFSGGALIFGVVLVAQRNPARGAIAFAFVILSVCGLFLLLAAPFLMTATIIIYAGAIIVTFLFVLMLSRADGPSDENDRSREPLAGAFAGFAFVGLVLFTLYQTSPVSRAEGRSEGKHAGGPEHRDRLLAQVLTDEERTRLADAIPKLAEAEDALDGDTSTHGAREKRAKAFDDALTPVKKNLAPVVGVSKRDGGRRGSILERLADPHAPAGESRLYRDDPQARSAVDQAARVRELLHSTGKRVETIIQSDSPDVFAAKAEVRKLREAVVVLHGMGQLPARNVANLGYSLYSEHLLAVELAGTLLLVATVGAIAISHRKGAAK